MRWRLVVAVTGLLLLLTACISGARSRVLVSGAVERDLSEAQVFYEESPGGRQLYIHQMGPGQDMIVLDIGLPAEVTPGMYDIGTIGPVTAAYYEFVDGVSRRFDGNVRGRATIERVDDSFSGRLELAAVASADSSQSVQITGEFSGIPYNRAGVTGSQATSTLAALVVMAALVVFLVANFVFQFYVGKRVYEADGGWALRSLRGTRTFIRGWQLTELRAAMAMWSLALGGLVLCIILVVLMGLSGR